MASYDVTSTIWQALLTAERAAAAEREQRERLEAELKGKGAESERTSALKAGIDE